MVDDEADSASELDDDGDLLDDAMQSDGGDDQDEPVVARTYETKKGSSLYHAPTNEEMQSELNIRSLPSFAGLGHTSKRATVLILPRPSILQLSSLDPRCSSRRCSRSSCRCCCRRSARRRPPRIRRRLR